MKNYLSIILAVIISLCCLYFEGSNENINNPIEAYRVYVEGVDIGLIESRDELEEYINNKQEALRTKYNVSKVYIPNDIDIVKDITYEDNLVSVEEIYNKISVISPFTIKGYTVTIDKTNSSEYLLEYTEESTKEKILTFNILNKDVLEESVQNVILAFVTNEEYDDFKNDKVNKNITTTGSYVENIYVEDKITIKESYISTENTIYMDSNELTNYLIYGSNTKLDTYKVKSGDTLEDIALNNKMSVNELIIINSDITDENTLLYSGQIINVGSITPLLNVIVEKHEVEDQSQKYKTTYIYDNTMYQGQWTEEQAGINGVSRVTKKIKYLNGEVYSSFITASETISEVVNRIVRKGGRQTPIGDGEWVWPTNQPHQISSGYGYRWGSFHGAVDITTAKGNGSPIYAAHSGTVLKVSNCESSRGYYVIIDHGNGLYSQYCHLKAYKGKNSASKYIKKGDYVTAGTVIGDMGSTGYSTGTHLDFSIWTCIPWSNGCPASKTTTLNPLKFY